MGQTWHSVSPTLQGIIWESLWHTLADVELMLGIHWAILSIFAWWWLYVELLCSDTELEWVLSINISLRPAELYHVFSRFVARFQHFTLWSILGPCRPCWVHLSLILCSNLIKFGLLLGLCWHYTAPILSHVASCCAMLSLCPLCILGLSWAILGQDETYLASRWDRYSATCRTWRHVQKCWKQHSIREQ